MNHYRKLNRAFFQRKPIGLIVFATMLALAAYPVWRVWAAAGDLDTSFSGDGKYSILTASVYNHQVNDVRIQTPPNNAQVEKVVALHSVHPFLAQCGGDDDYDFMVMRLTPEGSPDSTFGNNGVQKVNFPGTGRGTAMELQSNGSILIAGNLDLCNTPKPGLARLTPDGALDTSFGTNGTVTFSGHAVVYDMVLQPDGKIVLVGKKKQYVVHASAPIWHSAIWRLNADGSYDTTFNGSGLKTMLQKDSLTNGGQDENFTSAFVQTDGKIVALNHQFSAYTLRRVTASGATDGSLVVNGVGYANLVKGVGSKIWVVGTRYIQDPPSQANLHGMIDSYNADGSIDTTFGNGAGTIVSEKKTEGSVVAPVPFTFPAKYVIVGRNYYKNAYDNRGVITRCFATGAIDTSFGTNGSVETAGFTLNGGVAQTATYRSVRVGLSGNIVAGGVAAHPIPANSTLEFGVIARYWGN